MTLVVAVALIAPSARAATYRSPSCSAGPVVAGDKIYGTPCNDRIVVPPGVTAVDGGRGDDTIVAGPLVAATDCSAGCYLDIGSQTLEGGPGDDVVYGERGNDRLYGGPGNDQLFGGIGDDLLRGGPGDDRLAGGFGADAIDGEEGNDYVRGDATQDEIVDRGGGTDTLSYSTGITPGFFDSHTPPIEFAALPGLPPVGDGRGVYVDLSGSDGDNGVAPFGGGVDEVEGEDFEVVIGTAFSDYLVGSDRAETFYGGGGGDVVLAGGGDDALFGGADGDHLDGGSGNNAIDGGPGADHCENPGAGTSCESGTNTGGVIQRDPSKIAVGALAPGGSQFTQLYLGGSDGDDDVTAAYAAGGVTFNLGSGSIGSFDSGSTAGEGCDAPVGGKVVCPLTKPLDSIVLAGLGGDDTLTASDFPSSVSVVLAGGEGDDSLSGGNASEDVLIDGTDEEGGGEDVLAAGGGDDALTNNGGADELHGGDGNDLFLSTTICDGDLIDGGAKRDNASWGKFKESAVEGRLDTGEAGEPGAGGAPECPGGTLDSLQAVEDFEGTALDDVFYGDDGENQLLGWAGEDEYSAGGGKDRILANSGDFDPRIECGDGVDVALIDFPEFGDIAAPDCENVQEAPKNNFRIETELEVPPQEETPNEATPPPEQPTRPTAHPRGPARPNCLGATRFGSTRSTARCTVRPHRVRLARRVSVRGLRWRFWRAGRAAGFGDLLIRGRRSAPVASRVKLVLARPQRCGGRRWYRRVRLFRARGGGWRRFRAYVVPAPCASARRLPPAGARR